MCCVASMDDGSCAVKIALSLFSTPPHSFVHVTSPSSGSLDFASLYPRTVPHRVFPGGVGGGINSRGFYYTLFSGEWRCLGFPFREVVLMRPMMIVSFLKFSTLFLFLPLVLA